MDRATVEVYEASAGAWQASRPPRERDRAEALAARAGRPVADLGCGAGGYTGVLGRPVLAVDAARAMLDLTGAAAPGAWV
ncbi:MAG TPA: hypothetical protein VGB14_01615, partial [Acidimicrobiales bacterium]